MDSRAKELLYDFVAAESHECLRPIDRERFYTFALRVHALRLQADAQEVRQYLAKNGFSEKKAEELAILFDELRDFLRYYDKVKKGGDDGTTR